MPFALLHLLHCLLSKSPSVAGAAYAEIRALAAAKAIKLQAFFSQYKKPICQVKRVCGLESACLWVLCVYLGNGAQGQNCVLLKVKSHTTRKKLF